MLRSSDEVGLRQPQDLQACLPFLQAFAPTVITYKQITVSLTKVEGKWVRGLMSKELQKVKNQHNMKGRTIKAPLFRAGLY